MKTIFLTLMLFLSGCYVDVVPEFAVESDSGSDSECDSEITAYPAELQPAQRTAEVGLIKDKSHRSMPVLPPVHLW